VCLGGRGPAAPWPHGQPAGDLQDPEHPGRNAGAAGGDPADGVRGQRPHVHVHLPVHVPRLRQHADRPRAAARQVGRALLRVKPPRGSPGETRHKIHAGTLESESESFPLLAITRVRSVCLAGTGSLCVWWFEYKSLQRPHISTHGPPTLDV